jgi:hypothetical protein
MQKIIILLLILFSLVQLRLLYNEHLVLQSYTPEEKIQNPIGWYQLHTYGSALVYVAIILFSGNYLFSEHSSNEWQPTTTFVKANNPLPNSYGKKKNAFRIMKRKRKIFNSV